MSSWICSTCQMLYPAEGRADRLCAICGVRVDAPGAREGGQESRVAVVSSRSHPDEVHHVEMRPDGTLK